MLLTVLERLAQRRRRAGAHPAWTAVTLAAFLLRRYQQRSRRHDVVLREELKPGESVLISHTPQPRG
ncbi:MAG: hypothetical protein ABIY48_10340 [Acidimicrobiales bacterium]